MDGPAAAPELEMRLGVNSCTLGPFPVPRLGGGAGGAERIVLLDALMCVTQQAAGGSCYVWVRPSMRRKSAAEDDRTSRIPSYFLCSQHRVKCMYLMYK